jgi:hypothetical protein
LLVRLVEDGMTSTIWRAPVDPGAGRARAIEPAENAIVLPDGDQVWRTAAQPLKRKLA